MQLSRLPSSRYPAMKTYASTFRLRSTGMKSPKVLCLKISFPFPLQQQRLPHHVSILLEPHPLHCRWLNPNHITERSKPQGQEGEREKPAKATAVSH